MHANAKYREHRWKNKVMPQTILLGFSLNIKNYYFEWNHPIP
jgi:hypothetical protein